MITRILTPIDGSQSSETALTIACCIAGLSNAELIGVFIEDERRFRELLPTNALLGSVGVQPVIETPLPPDKMLNAIDAVEKESDELRQQFLKACSENSVTGNFSSEHGLPAEKIIELAKSVDLVVIGNSGRHQGLSFTPRGSTVTALLHHTTCPVFITPEEPIGTNDIVIAYDGSPGAERAMRHTAEMADMLDIDDVYVLTISSDPKEAARIQAPALDYLSGWDFAVHAERRAGKPHEEILGYVSSMGCSILALGAYGANSIKERLFGSTTNEIISNTTSALLLVP